jgi:hypothetical protein
VLAAADDEGLAQQAAEVGVELLGFGELEVVVVDAGRGREDAVEERVAHGARQHQAALQGVLLRSDLEEVGPDAEGNARLGGVGLHPADSVDGGAERGRRRGAR